MKIISTSNAAIMENTKCSIIKACTPAIDLKLGVSLDHSVAHYASFCFQLFEHFGQHLKQRIA